MLKKRILVIQKQGRDEIALFSLIFCGITPLWLYLVWQGNENKTRQWHRRAYKPFKPSLQAKQCVHWQSFPAVITVQVLQAELYAVLSVYGLGVCLIFQGNLNTVLT